MNGTHFDPLAWDTGPIDNEPAPQGKAFALEFECGGSFKWFGKAFTLAAAEAKARAALASEYHTFNATAARLVTMEVQ